MIKADSTEAESAFSRIFHLRSSSHFLQVTYSLHDMSWQKRIPNFHEFFNQSIKLSI